jgi:hypothetical protein
MCPHLNATLYLRRRGRQFKESSVPFSVYNGINCSLIYSLEKDVRIWISSAITQLNLE